MTLSRTLNLTLLIIAIVFTLIMTKAYLLPFILALVIWYMLRVVRDFVRKIDFVKKYLPSWLQNVLILLVIFVPLVGLSEMLAASIQEFSKVLPDYQKNFEKINQGLIDSYNFDALGRLQKYTGNMNFTGIVEPILNSLSSIVSNGVMIIIYCSFLILEESVFNKKFKIILSKDKEHEEQVLRIWNRIDQSFSSYIALKTFVSLLTGVLSYVALLLLNVDSPALWSIIIFLFNYIPNIGSIIATFFPVVVAMLQYGEILPGVYVLIAVGAIQLIIGNVVEPRVMGNSLNISPLMVIVALTVWGAIWGIIGMVLSVPITVMLIIIFAQFPQTENLAIFLSENGNLNPGGETARE